MKEVKIIIKPEGKAVSTPSGSSFQEAIAGGGITINTPCGGLGKCGKCLVQVVEGDFPATDVEKRFISDEKLSEGYRLACQMKVTSDCTVFVPEETRVRAKRILSYGVEREVKLNPQTRKVFLRLEEPTVEDNVAHCERIRRDLGVAKLSFEHEVLQHLHSILLDNSFSATFALDGDIVTSVEAGDTSGSLLGVAFDIGTTTVVGKLFDLRTGENLSYASAMNPQTTFGEDVVSRINHTITNPEGLSRLQSEVVKVINMIISEACSQAGVKTDQVYEVVAVGNTTMNHLLLGINPASLASSPYVPVVTDPVKVKASELGIRINRCGKLYVLPNIAGFVGSDTVAVILSTGLMESRKNRLAIDIGTNGEIVVGSRERLVSCSTAAGPAFEGARISQGMRAADGAIEGVAITDGTVELKIIGGVAPRGICGSGLFDAVAQLLMYGIVDSTGRILDPDELDGKIPGSLSKLIDRDELGNRFILVSAEGDRREIALTQRDIREVQLAKGAISSGVKILLKDLGLDFDDIEEILIAGAFGNYIRKEHAIKVGVIPPVPLEKVTFVGNAAAMGAQMALLSRGVREKAVEISRFTEYIELAGRPDFQAEFAEAMFF